MSWEHGQSHTATGTKVSLNALLLGPFRIDITPVASMAVNGPRTTAGTLGAQSFELIFPELDREKFPKSSAPIKLLCLGLHEAAPRSLSTNVSHPRPARISQRYKKAKIFKVQSLHGTHGRRSGGHKCGRECALPGEISGSATELAWSQGRDDKAGEVSRGHSRQPRGAEGPNMKTR
jgi:hypothetical protein